MKGTMTILGVILLIVSIGALIGFLIGINYGFFFNDFEGFEQQMSGVIEQQMSGAQSGS